MSHNPETKLQPVVSKGTIGTSDTIAVSSFVTDTRCYDILFGVESAAGNVLVGDATTQVVPITTSVPFSVASKSIDRQHIPLDPSDWTISGAEGDVVWAVYLVEVPNVL